MTELERAEAAAEQAWTLYGHLARNMPGCDHVREWQARMAAARKAHLDAIRARDELRDAEPRKAGDGDD